MLKAACTKEARQQHGCFELSVGNPDKGVLPKDEVQRRIDQFIKAGIPLVVTQVTTVQFRVLVKSCCP